MSVLKVSDTLQSEPTTRAEYFSQNGDGSSTPDSEVKDGIMMLETILKSSLEYAPTPVLLSTAVKTYNEDSTLCLISGTPVVSVTFSHPYHPTKPRDLPTEDTSSEAKFRKRRAREVAVDYDWILQQSRVQNNPHTIPKADSYTTTQLPPASLLIAQRDPSTSTSKIRYPVISVSSVIETPSPPRRNRKARSEHVPRPPPRFFHPGYELGGKSRGYALGHAWPGMNYRGAYERLQMSKGVETGHEDPLVQSRDKHKKEARPPGRKARRAAKLKRVLDTLDTKVDGVRRPKVL